MTTFNKTALIEELAIQYPNLKENSKECLELLVHDEEDWDNFKTNFLGWNWHRAYGEVFKYPSDKINNSIHLFRIHILENSNKFTKHDFEELAKVDERKAYSMLYYLPMSDDFYNSIKEQNEKEGFANYHEIFDYYRNHITNTHKELGGTPDDEGFNKWEKFRELKKAHPELSHYWVNRLVYLVRSKADYDYFIENFYKEDKNIQDAVREFHLDRINRKNMTLEDFKAELKRGSFDNVEAVEELFCDLFNNKVIDPVEDFKLEKDLTWADIYHLHKKNPELHVVELLVKHYGNEFAESSESAAVIAEEIENTKYWDSNL